MTAIAAGVVFPEPRPPYVLANPKQDGAIPPHRFAEGDEPDSLESGEESFQHPQSIGPKMAPGVEARATGTAAGGGFV